MGFHEPGFTGGITQENAFTQLVVSQFTDPLQDMINWCVLAAGGVELQDVQMEVVIKCLRNKAFDCRYEVLTLLQVNRKINPLKCKGT